MNKLVSIIVLGYNNYLYFEECMDTIFKQSYSNIELIIADDCSLNFNYKKIKDYILNKAGENIVAYKILRNEKNLGIVKNLNNAIKKASGEFIRILAMDDLLYDKHSLKNSIDYLNANDELVVLSETLILDEKDGSKKTTDIYKYKKLFHESNNYKLYRVMAQKYIHIHGMCYRKSFFEQYGLFDERFRNIEDVPMLFRIAKLHCPIGYINSITAIYRTNSETSIMNNFKNKNMDSPIVKENKLIKEQFLLSERKILGFKIYRSIKISYLHNYYLNDKPPILKIIVYLTYFDQILFRIIKKYGKN